MNIQDCLSENIRRIRKTRKLTQEQLARASGLSLQAIQLIESKKTWPEIKTITAIAVALGVEQTLLFHSSGLINDFKYYLNKLIEEAFG